MPGIFRDDPRRPIPIAADASKTGKEYVFNASEIARRIPTRKSVAKHANFVARVLSDLAIRRRAVTGHAAAEQLRKQNAHLKSELNRALQRLQALRIHHVEIYRRLYLHSIDAEVLIRPVLKKESRLVDCCILCGERTDPR